MTALALCAQDMGMKVSGSDVAQTFVTDEILKKRHINWHLGFDKKNIPQFCDLLVFTASHGGQANVEVMSALERGIPIYSQAAAVGLFMKGKLGISTCGVGGKSTTAAMLATILQLAGCQPSFVVGVGNIPSLGAPGKYQEEGKFFVAEADEYFDPLEDKPKFLFQNPQIIILSNIEHDHPDVYPDLASTMNAYRLFIGKLPKNGLLIANQDNKNIVKLFKTLRPLRFKVNTYGFSPNADWQIKDYQLGKKKAFFKLNNQEYELAIPGKFNAANAAAAIIVSNHLGLTYPRIREALRKFKGTKRRFEKIAQIKGIQLLDDYAHHPTEIKATLETVKLYFPGKRIIAVFQPHTYSRTKALLGQFAQSFTASQLVLITSIYASAREKDDLGISGQKLVNEIGKIQRGVFYLNDCRSVCNFLKVNVKSGDVIITLGAGDIFLWHDKIIEGLK